MSTLHNFGSVFYKFITLRLSNEKSLKTYLIEENSSIFSDVFCEDISYKRGFQEKMWSFQDKKTHQ